MNITALLDNYIINHRSGAERMEHNILRGMVERGHKARAIVRGVTEPTVFEGVEIYPKHLDTELAACRWSDVMLTSFNYSRRAMNVAKDTGRRLYIIIHNELHPDIMINTFKNTRVIYNSEWVGKSCKFKVPTIVFPPPVFESDWPVTGKVKREYVTMLNVAEIKGGDKFAELAFMMPETKFYGTIGSYGAQQITESRDNITISPTITNVNDLLRRTKVLLMPSRYESHGQTQIEAGFHSIPTIYHPTPGLSESWGEYGIALDRSDLEKWKEEIGKLFSDPVYYKERSDAALSGARAHQARTDWEGLENFMRHG